MSLSNSLSLSLQKLNWQYLCVLFCIGFMFYVFVCVLGVLFFVEWIVRGCEMCVYVCCNYFKLVIFYMSGVAAEVEVGCSCQVGDGVGVWGEK